ncbi:MAG TPA: hypothetical protein DEF43_14270 [Chloroflexus aurantiacus]|jgi:hypothetical protein|uniref:YD repeat protein n=1 Tax=Chloroflexus aurantiacus (strain ATCC 29366 / DSM 635 / J-10-fl) TaxID=324602 RepID=A9WB55_CHLAA|nr:hypothetical protein [Chloroflexus aurantiacus]ABY36848.1 hypothetical protein Caur_3665 [Chloroflexus aurantiacus J-10-fl]RMG48350.1 MAG: hypothetical protein D6716_13380 [Chloroflexota bacterium]HBW68298.1 hypothetical protein [Chloroflexus aurantiacus]
MWRSAGSGPVNPQDLNRYAYALNNPLTYTDPLRHLPLLPVRLIGGIALRKITFLTAAHIPTCRKSIGIPSRDVNSFIALTR